MAKEINVGSNLSKLYISGNRISRRGLVTFQRAIQTSTALKTLFCQFNNVTKSGIPEIEKCIKKLNILLEIHSSWHDINVDHKVAAIITSYCSFNLLEPNSEMPVDSLKWSIDALKDADYASDLLSMCLQENSTLKELNLRYVTVTSKVANKIAEVLKTNSTLQKLDVSCQNIGEDGAVAISNSLKINTL